MRSLLLRPHALELMPQASSTRYWTVRSSSIHNRGIFARRDIPADAPIIEYIGEKISKAESQRRGDALAARSKKTGGASVYIFTLNKRQDIDGAKGRNPARYINHSCAPNCEAYIIRGRIWIYSLREIKAGEELTYNYGFDVDTWEDHPCRCGTDRCVGFIVAEDQWPKLLQRMQKLEADVKKSREAAAKTEVATRKRPSSGKKSVSKTGKVPVANKKTTGKASKKASTQKS